jgi:hypothetical protein
MSSLGGSGSGSHELMTSRSSKDNEFSDFRSPPVYDDDSDYLADSSSRASLGLEPLDFDDANFEASHSMPRSRLFNAARSWIGPARNVTIFERQRYNSMARLTASFGRRPRISRLLYVFAVYFLVFLFVSLNYALFFDRILTKP